MAKQLELFPENSCEKAVKQKILEKEKLPTNITSNRHPIHRWFNFTAGFSPEFVNQCIKTAELSPNDVVLDPFAGLSTTLVQANFNNVRSIGFEVHPFFYAISSAKIFPPLEEQHINQIEKLIQVHLEPYNDDLKNVWPKDAEIFLSKLIPEPSLRSLASILQVEHLVNPDTRPLFRLIVSRVLELTAQSQTDGIYKAPTTEKNSISSQRALQKVCHEIREDIRLIQKDLKPKAILHQMSSERMEPVEDESCDLCVTSPPYLNNFDFAEMTRMELYYWRYAGSWREITEKVRRQLIVNTTTVPTDLKRAQSRFSKTLSEDLQMQLQPIVEALQEERRTRKGHKDYNLLVYPYFAQMQSVIQEIHRVLKPKSSLHLVVADAALYGTHIPTERLLAMQMQENGFTIQNIERLRDRGDRWILEKRQTSQQLGEFHIHARRI